MGSRSGTHPTSNVGAVMALGLLGSLQSVECLLSSHQRKKLRPCPWGGLTAAAFTDLLSADMSEEGNRCKLVAGQHLALSGRCGGCLCHKRGPYLPEMSQCL